MFGVTTPEMVAAAASVGCLGSLPLGDLTVEKSEELIQTTKRLTSHQFAVNLFVNTIPTITPDLRTRYVEVKSFIEKLAASNGIDVSLPDLDQLKLETYHQQIDILIKEGCKIVSFTFGNMERSIIQKLKGIGVTLIGTCTSVSEALALGQSGIDILCVQGFEAGGHRGSFADENIPKIGGLSLLSKVFDAVKTPIIYAGGLYNARTLEASRLLGAQGFQVGSMLIASAESASKPLEKERLKSLKEDDIILTKSFSGRYARGIKNKFTANIDDTAYILPYPLQNKLTAELRRVAKANNNIDFVNIWVGQSINTFSTKSTSDILKALIDEVEQEHRKLT